jgi:hypothetical protein
MSLLQDLVNEMSAAGATGAGSVASAPGSLFGGGTIDLKAARKKQRIMMRRIGFSAIREALGVDLGKTKFDASDVISKLDAAQKKSKVGKGTTAFGMEDEDGQLVKVYVKSEQAEDFELTLSAMLAGEDEEEDGNTSVEIAEVLFKLKDKFEIVDVEWPTIKGDEEEEQEVEGGEEDMTATDQAPEGEGGEVGGDLEGEPAGNDTAASALAQVIDAMKADSRAKEAEARAREAEANAEEAKYAAQSAESKIRQEEAILDMETYNKQKGDQSKESKQLAALAKYKHDINKDRGSDKFTAESNRNEPSEEDEEESDEDGECTDDNAISQDELAKLIFTHLRGQS